MNSSTAKAFEHSIRLAGYIPNRAKYARLGVIGYWLSVIISPAANYVIPAAAERRAGIQPTL
ncbi:hypothetical protein D1AOALGA4SA_836 [Olavius algarvensis Delta 1 endosymbiont]|nr:hypothetical protein D1AOALGA4SA_836 [Olavius algarvensis Delta 1 endosymbiont]